MTQLPTAVQNEIAGQVDSIEHYGNILREALDDALNWTQVGGEAPATYTGGLRTWDFPVTSLRGRDEGRHHPFYETEYELKRMRAACRRLATFTSIAVGAQKALQVYVMGGDWEYEVVARDDVEPSQGLLDECNAVLKANLERNDFIACLDNEIHDTVVEDGEAVVAGYATPDGLTDLRVWNADHLREPQRKSALEQWIGETRLTSWSFGVHTVFDERMGRIDHTKHQGYHMVWDDGGTEWDYLPCWPQASLNPDTGGKFGHFIKRNVPLTAKRGISDYWPVLTDLEREDKLSENTSVGAAILAAIPWIEEVQTGSGAGPTKAEVQSSIASSIDQYSRALRDRTGSERTQRKFRAGSVQVVKGKKYIAGPMGQVRSPIYIEVGKALTRRIGLRWVFPYYMISGDASESSLASTLVAESPFVKARQCDQQFFVASFRKLNFKMLKIAADAGRFRSYGVRSWADLQPAIDMRIVPSPVASRNKKELLDELFGMYDRQIMEANEVRTQLGHEAEQELEGKTGMGVGLGMGLRAGADEPQGDGDRMTPDDSLPQTESMWEGEVSRRSGMASAIWEDYP